MSLIPQKVKLSDVKNFVEGNVKYYTSTQPHETEQILLRMYLCKECLDNTKCLHCGCKTPHMFYAPNKQDSLGRFAEFFSKNQWEALKNNIIEYEHFFRLLSSGEIHGYLRQTGSIDGLPDRVNSDSLESITENELRTDKKD
jgi:hypothetical protein